MPFVNPYNFVPLPDVVSRTEPRSRTAASGPDRWSGRVDIELELRSPLKLPATETAGTTDDYPVVRGSSLHGSIRNMHEVLTDSCMRVLDTDFVPVYREPVALLPKEWTVVRIDSLGDDGEILATAAERRDVIKALLWSPEEGKKGVFGAGPPRTGDLFAWPRTGIDRPKAGPPRIVDGTLHRAESAEGSHGVVLISDGGTRTANKRWYVAFARMDNAVPVSVSPEAMTSFKKASENSDDSQQRRNAGTAGIDDNPLRHVEVHAPSTTEVIGFRDPSIGDPWPGRVLWGKVETVDGRRVVTELKVSQVWRALGETPVEERVPPAVLPCESGPRLRIALGLDPAATESWNNPEMRGLCPSCLLFGSAVEDDVDLDKPRRQGPQPRNERRGRSGGYRGRVRVADALLVDENGQPSPVHNKDLAPMGTPHPGAGQFYLVNDGLEHKTTSNGERPLAWWSAESHHDSPPRQIRGRKFYWRTDVDVESQTARSAPTDTEAAAESMAASQHGARIVQPGGRMTVTLFVDDVTRAELGALLASVAPGLVLGPDDSPSDYVLSIGGGKPFGFGSVAVRTEDGAPLIKLDLATARGRYLGADDQTAPTVTEAVDAFLAAVDRNANSARWRALTAMTRFAHVDDALVRYPNDARGIDAKPVPGRGEDSDYEFWQFTSGQPSTVESKINGRTVRVDSKLRSLPAPDKDDASMLTGDELRKKGRTPPPKPQKKGGRR
ncbi:RAMP superfamily CRISPR-associated protein [Phytoactinopolyspora limicola]|uniref:RAMP superfamily CRISPR-associated protein n=1 Tax=Phytoactinopolyspora limicola TaxID=2715536 RepID=UPI00140D5FCD|nr:RAMP superfamily CRISPR-associated protein [Phytoactinopolyspora limicola]